MDVDTVVRTRQSLHGVAELVLAWPQFRRSGTIRLRITDVGFATVRTPVMSVQGTDLVAQGARVPLPGRTYAELGQAVGVEVVAPEGLYHDGSGMTPQDEVDVDPGAVRVILDAFIIGDRALRRFTVEHTPVLWPEHFDVAITVDEVNYGVSAGDSYHAEPYAYVGPWSGRVGSFWNAPFGAARPLRELRDVDGVLAFLQEGRHRAEQDPLGKAGRHESE